MSFELRGRDEDGVVHFTGLDRGPALLEWLAVMALGLVFLSALVAGGIAAAARGHAGIVLAAVPLAVGVVWLAVGGSVWWLRVRRRLATLRTLRDLSDQTGVGEDDLLRAAKRAELLPVYRVNRVDLYDPAGFDAGSLLRPSDNDARLLLPARGTESAESLPRPTDGP